MLRVVTYLAPSLPLRLFEVVTEALSSALAMPVSLVSETRYSGPPPSGPDPFADGDADLGFMCAPACLWRAKQTQPSLEILPAAPLFDDPRLAGRPAYFSDVVVRADHKATALNDLADARWAYNDPCSLSGYLNVVRAFKGLDAQDHFASTAQCSGSHLNSIEWLLDGQVEAAAIDSNVLRLALRQRAGAPALRVVASIGPSPVQPVVAASRLPAELKAELATALLSLAERESVRRELAEFGLLRFAPVSPADYADELWMVHELSRVAA